MTTKTLDQQTARLIASVATCLPPLSSEVMQSWIDNPQGLKKLLGGLDSPVPTEEAKPAPLFSIIAASTVGALGEKKTGECFPKPLYVYRDKDFDSWLPATQPKTDACAISTLAFTKDWTFAEAAAKVLALPVYASAKVLGKALIAGGHTTTLAQVEEMVEKTERGENTGVRADGYGNFFFVETGNEDEPVSVGDVYRDGRDWVASVYSLGSGIRWGADDRLLVRNLDASKL